ncbi:MAG: D-hexose-6-phosphate mutarotase [Victivallaceae bacterium]|nr:D-hexose-6-phosphate mutarotase [Victivallaceae bacterium]
MNNPDCVSSVRIEAGPGKLPVVVVENALCRCTVALHGAHVLSYAPRGGRELFFLSEKSDFADRLPIRGGVPVCWPWFSAHPEHPEWPKHGFARLTAWELTEVKHLADGSDQLTLVLPDAACGKCGLKPMLKVTAGALLSVDLTTVNASSAPVSFSAALHSYYAVGAISQIRVEGLAGKRFIDTLDNTMHEQAGAILFDRETDRIYPDSAEECVIVDPRFGRRIRVSKRGSRSTVVWNPWIAKSKAMPDFGDEEYHRMVCVETANVRDDARTLAPGEEHTLGFTVAVETL